MVLISNFVNNQKASSFCFLKIEKILDKNETLLSFSNSYSTSKQKLVIKGVIQEVDENRLKKIFDDCNKVNASLDETINIIQFFLTTNLGYQIT
ncbi:MAG: hypothetical protein ACFFD1_14335 [Candidatus Thorarchaeota archaeon]